MRYQCFKEENSTLLPAAGCAININLVDGVENGGHNHGSSPIRRGLLNVRMGERIIIPEQGLSVTYEAPELAGEVQIQNDGWDPNGGSIGALSDSFIQIRSSTDFIKLSVPGLVFDVASHPRDGDYGRMILQEKLNEVVKEFREIVIEDFGITPPTLESEGANLSWGGVFDYKSNWMAPHCAHRHGIELDISMSVFNVYNSEQREALRILLKDVFDSHSFKFPVETERSLGANHWHVKLAE